MLDLNATRRLGGEKLVVQVLRDFVAKGWERGGGCRMRGQNGSLQLSPSYNRRWNPFISVRARANLHGITGSRPPRPQGPPPRSHIPPRIVDRFTTDLDEDFQFRSRVMPKRRETDALEETLPGTPENSTTSKTVRVVGPDVWRRNAFQYGGR